MEGWDGHAVHYHSAVYAAAAMFADVLFGGELSAQRSIVGRSDEARRKTGGWSGVCGRTPDDVQLVSSYRALLPSFLSSRYSISSSSSSSRRMKSGDDVDGSFDVGRPAIGQGATGR